MITELQYADDLDFLSKDAAYLEEVHNICVEDMPQHNLKVNSSKTERTHFFLDNDTEKRGLEDWRNAKSLGSLAGTANDVDARCARASQVFRQLISLFKSSKVSLALKIRLYDCYVKSVLLYSVTWGMTEAVGQSLDAFHRKQLRAMVGVRHPNKISNRDLYSNCNANPLTTDIAARRWSFLGHVLRMPADSPPQLSLDLAVSGDLRGRVGRPRTTLLLTLRKDCQAFAGIPMKTARNLDQLRRMASDRVAWGMLAAAD